MRPDLQQHLPTRCDPRRARAFTLVEMLVVLAIIGLILALSLPNIRSMSEGRTMEGAARQLLDDLAYARQHAIANRSTVVVLFLSPEVQDAAVIDPFDSFYSAPERDNILQLQAGALNTYSIFAMRSAGEQPGRGTQRYLTEWRTLPDKVFLPEAAFTGTLSNGFFGINANSLQFPYPTGRSGRAMALPYVAFTSMGRCLPVDGNGTPKTDAPRDVFIPLAGGSILYTRDATNGALATWSAQEVPVGNSTNNVIHIDWLTGRARLERPDVTKP